MKTQKLVLSVVLMALVIGFFAIMPNASAQTDFLAQILAKSGFADSHGYSTDETDGHILSYLQIMSSSVAPDGLWTVWFFYNSEQRIYIMFLAVLMQYEPGTKLSSEMTDFILNYNANQCGPNLSYSKDTGYLEMSYEIPTLHLTVGLLEWSVSKIADMSTTVYPVLNQIRQREQEQLQKNDSEIPKQGTGDWKKI